MKLGQRGQAKMDTIIEYVIAIVIAVVLFSIINTTCTDAAENATGIAATLLPLVPAFYVFGVLMLAVGWIRHEYQKK